MRIGTHAVMAQIHARTSTCWKWLQRNFPPSAPECENNFVVCSHAHASLCSLRAKLHSEVASGKTWRQGVTFSIIQQAFTHETSNNWSTVHEFRLIRNIYFLSCFPFSYESKNETIISCCDWWFKIYSSILPNQVLTDIPAGASPVIREAWWEDSGNDLFNLLPLDYSSPKSRGKRAFPHLIKNLLQSAHLTAVLSRCLAN